MIIVTGGSGKVGRACVKDLMEHGFKVASIDLAKPAGLSNPPKPTDVTFSRVDITDFGQVMAAFSGINERVDEKVEGIVHLGAIASPGEATDHVIFHTNLSSTYNVFEAARRLGIHNVVWASSETVYGIPYADGPAYVPVDEEIELAEWSYSLSKLMGEKLAERAMGQAQQDHRIAVLQCAGAAGLCQFSELPGRRQDPALQPVDLYRRARRGAGGSAGAQEHINRGACLRHR